MINYLKIETITKGNGVALQLATAYQFIIRACYPMAMYLMHPGLMISRFSFQIGAGQVIRGLEQGVSGMKVGELRKLTIPPKLGYGSKGAGNTIPPDCYANF